MSVDFQQVRQKVIEIGKHAHERAAQRKNLLEKAQATLLDYHDKLDELQVKVQHAALQNPSLRCAKPNSEPLGFRRSCPSPPEAACLLAVDGSQITPSRHDAVEFGLINLGAITLPYGGLGEIQEKVTSQLLFDDALFTEYGRIGEQSISLLRDLRERIFLAEVAESLPKPLFTFTDGPLELWFGSESLPENDKSSVKKTRDEYIASLEKLRKMEACTAGYIDNPASVLVLQMLEIAETSESVIKRDWRGGKYRMLRDVQLFSKWLQPGERSAVFALRSRPTDRYPEKVSLHFFYLNVGREENPWLARVEIPRWVAEDKFMLDHLHALLIHECKKLGARSFPYILHRSHEVAIVKLEEKKQLELMLAQTLGVFGDGTYKQGLKESGGRTGLRP
jgi:hypothetical protein